MVSFCCEIFLLCAAALLLTFFIAGLLYLLRFERVDNLGAYSIPSETGLLIPSVYVNGRYTRIQRDDFAAEVPRGFLLFRRSRSCYRLCAFCFSALLSSYPHAFHQALR